MENKEQEIDRLLGSIEGMQKAKELLEIDGAADHFKMELDRLTHRYYQLRQELNITKQNPQS